MSIEPMAFVQPGIDRHNASVQCDVECSLMTGSDVANQDVVVNVVGQQSVTSL